MRVVNTTDVRNIDCSPQYKVVFGNRTDHILMMLDLKDNRVDLNDVINYIVGEESKDPTNLEEAMKSKNHLEWKKAMINEYENLLRRGVVKIVIPPPGEIIREIDSKLVFKTKIKNNKIFKYKWDYVREDLHRLLKTIIMKLMLLWLEQIP